MNNIGEQVHRQVIDTGILPILVKIVKKKVDHSLVQNLLILGSFSRVVTKMYLFSLYYRQSCLYEKGYFFF